MRDLTARRLRTLVHLMAERTADRSPCAPGTLLEEVITAVPRDHDGSRSGLFQEFLRATDSLADTGLLTKDASGWSLTASGRATAASSSALGEALDDALDDAFGKRSSSMELAGSTSRAIDAERQSAFPAGMAADACDRRPRRVGLTGGFLPAGSPNGVTRQQPWAAAQRPAWAADDSALQLSYDADGDIWSVTLAMEPGHYEYKVVLDSSWQENYGVRGMLSGPNLVLDLSTSSTVTFSFDHVTKILVST